MREMGKTSCLLKHEDVIYQHIRGGGIKVLNVKLKTFFSQDFYCVLGYVPAHVALKQT